MDNSKILSDSLKESRTFQFLEKFYDIFYEHVDTDDEESFMFLFVLDFAKAIISDFGFEDADRLGNVLIGAAKNRK